MNGKAILKTALALLLCAALLAACSPGDSVRLNPKNPVILNLWHYYNGAQKTAFDEIVREFNNTVGIEKGIVIETRSYAGVNELADYVIASAAGEAGTDPLPDIFAAYADSAYIIHDMGRLADIKEYFTDAELSEYMPSFLDEGRLMPDGQLCIFPTGKSTEALLLNRTDWDAFLSEIANTHPEISLDSFSTYEGIYEAAAVYHEWSGGKALFGVDSVANLLYAGSRMLGADIQSIEDGAPRINLDREILRRIFDFYYGGVARGYIGAYGRFRSDDAKVGELLAYTGSTTAGRYFPTTVTTADGQVHDIAMTALPSPVFEDGKKIAVQQGAGLCVSKSTPQKEYAASLFFKWFTEPALNTRFSVESGGYMPVKKAALGGEDILREIEALRQTGDQSDANVAEIITVASDQMLNYQLYTSPAFAGSKDIRAALDDLAVYAAAGREQYKTGLAAGLTPDEAMDRLDIDQAFQQWMQSLEDTIAKAMEGS